MLNKLEYMTREGYETLERDLDYLKTVTRDKIAARLNQILEEGGDPNENTEYEFAKNEQALIEERIARMSQILRHARIIEKTDSDTAQPGSKVTVQDRDTKEEEMYHIVGSAEANPIMGKVSMESPMGIALMDKKVGDKFTVNAPDGELRFKVLSIE
ncbi:MAG: transcription elongation factor GreA [Aggregatilineales bacterium]